MEAEKQEREEKMQFEIKLHETKLKLQEDLQIKAGNQQSTVETTSSSLPSLMGLTPTGRDSGVDIPKLLTKPPARDQVHVPKRIVGRQSQENGQSLAPFS